ncbi:MAG TPA: hydroxyisourate hydrolase [Pyrinomonadaceae bacterium]|nr:hydroxyisourate hydrolase [Pyrinomonadaceae bacterium]
MSGITTHILDVSIGRPAPDVHVTLERKTDGVWEKLGDQRTDSDGRARELFRGPLATGVHRLTFAVGAYFENSFYEDITIAFVVDDASQHYHVPLLLSPFGYSTYRGS